MVTPVLLALCMLVLPVALFLAGGVFMMRATGRARFRQRRREPASTPLNFRLRGYDAPAAVAYWHWLGADGRAAELRFLKADMIFPLWYGGIMLGSLHLGWSALGNPSPFGIPALPVAITVVADWIENTVHIRQIGRFDQGQPLQDRHLRIASLATTTKLLFFWLSTLLIVGLAASLLVVGLRNAP